MHSTVFHKAFNKLSQESLLQTKVVTDDNFRSLSDVLAIISEEFNAEPKLRELLESVYEAERFPHVTIKPFEFANQASLNWLLMVDGPSITKHFEVGHLIFIYWDKDQSKFVLGKLKHPAVIERPLDNYVRQAPRERYRQPFVSQQGSIGAVYTRDDRNIRDNRVVRDDRGARDNSTDVRPPNNKTAGRNARLLKQMNPRSEQPHIVPLRIEPVGSDIIKSLLKKKDAIQVIESELDSNKLSSNKLSSNKLEQPVVTNNKSALEQLDSADWST